MALCIFLPSILTELFPKMAESCNPWLHSSDSLQDVHT